MLWIATSEVFCVIPIELLSLPYEIAHLVKPPLKISALGAVATQGERPLVSIGSSLMLVRPPQQIGARGMIGVIAASLIFESQQRLRSEERRVGKECRSRWSPYH